MKKIIRYFLVGMLGLALLGGAILHAVPAPQVPRKVVLPDGSSITLIVHGDEYVSWLTTTDGYSVKKNQAGYFEYVREVKDGQCVLSGVRAYDPSVRPQKEKRFLKKIQPNLKEPVSNASRSGMRKGVKASEAEWLKSPQDFASKPDFKGVLVPVNFSDYPLVTSEKTIDSLMNFAGYTTSWGLPGSVRDYFYDMSQGQFEFSIDVLPAYTALQCRECYGKEAPTLKEEVESYVLEMLGERAADYDRNKDGYIDHISIIFAGQGQESTGTEGMIWSHSYSEWYNGGSGWAKSRACIAEIDNLYDSRPGIETYCHEFGHVLGLPDHYDSKYTYWTWEHPAEADLMSANTGRGIPVPMSAFSRFCLGWTRFKTLSAATAGTFRLQDMLQEYHALRYNTTTPGEFFVLENRTPLNKWQSYPENGSGMLIFRVDSAGYRSRLADNTVNAGYDHMCFELLRADNSSNYYDKESDFFPYNGTYTSFTDNTTPSSQSLAGKNTNLPITNIRQENNIISFNFVSQGNQMLAVSGDITPDTLWGVYKAIGEVIQSNGNLCAQKGFCYGLLPTPTVSGNKVEATGEGDAFCVSLDLRNFVPGAVINVRAYATDHAGNTVYGAKQQITLPKVPVKVSDYYVARKKDNDFIPNMFKEYQGIELDLSEMTSPMVEVYYNENPWSSTAMNILVSSDNGRNYQEAAPTKIVHQNKVNTHIYSYSLPAPSKHYRIILTIYNVDSLIVKEGIPYQLTPTPASITNVSPVSGNAYRATGWDPKCNSLPSTILSVNTSRMTKPVLHWRGEDEDGAILLKTASQQFYSTSNLNPTDCGITFKKRLKSGSTDIIRFNPNPSDVTNGTRVSIECPLERFGEDAVIYFKTFPTEVHLLEFLKKHEVSDDWRNLGDEDVEAILPYMSIYNADDENSYPMVTTVSQTVFVLVYSKGYIQTNIGDYWVTDSPITINPAPTDFVLANTKVSIEYSSAYLGNDVDIYFKMFKKYSDCRNFLDEFEDPRPYMSVYTENSYPVITDSTPGLYILAYSNEYGFIPLSGETYNNYTNIATFTPSPGSEITDGTQIAITTSQSVSNRNIYFRMFASKEEAEASHDTTSTCSQYAKSKPRITKAAPVLKVGIDYNWKYHWFIAEYTVKEGVAKAGELAETQHNIALTEALYDEDYNNGRQNYAEVQRNILANNQSDEDYYNNWQSYMDLRILPDYTLALPQDTLVHILLAHNGYVVEVLDFEDQSLYLRRLQAIDNTTVEIEGLRLPQDNLPILDQEYGICWNTVPTPTLANRKALSGNEYNFVCPLTGLPEATLYFYTYAKNGQDVSYSSRYLVSEFTDGQRKNILPFDDLNTVVPIGKTAETYTVRARYLSSQLEQSTTQGICHNEYSGNGLPDINSSTQYNENNLGTVNYYNIETQGRNLRTFVMDSKGAVSYGPLAEISACTNEQKHPYRPGKILKAPCDLIEDAAQYANDYRIKGTDYWKKPLIKNNYGYSSGMDASSNYIRFQYSRTSDSTFISPIIDQSALSLPVLFLSIKAPQSESPNDPKTFSVWGINVRTGEKTLLRYIEREKYENLGGDYNDEGGYYPYGERFQKVAIPLKAAGDSIYLAFEFPRCPYGTASITIREMKIEDQLTPEVHTLRVSVDDKHEVSMNGQIEDLGQPDPVLRSGFVYSIYGDPLQDGSVAPLAESVEVNADSEGKFSFSFVQKMAAYVYCRAFATNAHGTSYGDLNSVAVCGEYLVTADDLPVTDNFRAPAFTASGQETSFSCNNGSYTFISGILDLKNRPTTHRIKVSADDINVHIPHTVADEYGLPYNAAYYSEWAEPFVQLFRSTTFLYYRTENDPEWKIMPEEAFTMNFGGGITYLNGDFISAFFSFEFHGPNDLSQIKMVSEDTRWTLLYFPSITYEVSERSDLTAVAPQIDYVTVEDKHNTLQWHIDDWNNVEKIVFYREGNTFGSLEALQEISYTPSAPLTGVFTDLSSVPSRKAYTYTVKSFNSEGWEYASTPHKTMHLTISKGIGTQWNLQWNPYEGRQVSSVSIYRGNSEGSLEFIDEIAGTNNSYTDVDAPEGDVFYVVEVAFTEPVAARKSQGAVSRSNVATNTVQQENYYTLTLGESYNGRVAAYYNGQNVPSGSMLEEGSLLTLTAIPDNGYQFESWMDGNTANPRDIMLNGDLYVSAIFTERQGNYNYYTVNITQTTFGWVSVSCNGQNIPSGSVLEEGSLLTLTAMPDSNCLFANWMDGDMSNPRTLVLNQDLHVSAAFIRQQGNSYTVNIVQTAHGQVTVSCNGQNVPSGSVLEEGSYLTLTATPDNGYQFESWMNGSINNPYNIILFQNENISATFKKKETPSGNEDGDKENAISVYPNPVSDVLYVSSPFVIVHAELRDLQGKVVYRRENFTETSIDMKNLPAGVYLLLCRNAQETYRSKVIKR